MIGVFFFCSHFRFLFSVSVSCFSICPFYTWLIAKANHWTEVHWTGPDSWPMSEIPPETNLSYENRLQWYMAFVGSFNPLPVCTLLYQWESEVMSMVIAKCAYISLITSLSTSWFCPSLVLNPCSAFHHSQYAYGESLGNETPLSFLFEVFVQTVLVNIAQ